MYQVRESFEDLQVGSVASEPHVVGGDEGMESVFYVSFYEIQGISGRALVLTLAFLYGCKVAVYSALMKKHVECTP